MTSSVIRLCAAVLLVTATLGWSTRLSEVSAAAPSTRVDVTVAAQARGPYVTLLFSRTETTAADDCVARSAGIARLDTVVAPYLSSRGMSATGTLVTGRTRANAMTCTHVRSSLTASWSQARRLADRHGWSFTSHTATYPSNLASLTPTQVRAETCGSARTIGRQGLPGGHGMISYPGAQPQPVALQRDHAARCFAWGREYGSDGVTLAAAGRTPPYWQHTYAANGGPCNDTTAWCHRVPATGSPRYRLPSRLIGIVNTLGPGRWFTLQAYVLVTGRSPAYSTSPIRWDCTSADPRLHWTNDNERYCYRDWQAVVRAVAAKPGVVVTDPQTVGAAFGRPAP